MKKRNCGSCSFADSAIAPPRMVLICNNRQYFQGQFYVISPADSCSNYRKLTKETAAKKYPENATCLIPLTQGKYALVDAEDYPELARYKWNAARNRKTFYAVRKGQGTRKIRMHRLIMNAPDHLLVDHIDRNGLNNTKKNLRLATHQQNNYNRKKLITKKNSSKYKGVTGSNTGNRFYARVSYKGRQYNLGRFKNETEAAKAYDKKARALFGEFACLNFPDLE